MDIKEFFELSAGKWFSQRTSHHLPFKQAESGKSEIVIEILPPDAPEVIKLCQEYQISPTSAWGGARITCDGMMEWDQTKQTRSSVLVFIPDSVKPQSGKLLLNVGYAGKPGVAGRYIIGSDDALTLITESETMYCEERVWFASPNLRLRTSVMKQKGGFSIASICSEIRMGLVKPQAQAADAAKA